jgi:preprotein translocase subunit YajC
VPLSGLSQSWQARAKEGIGCTDHHDFGYVLPGRRPSVGLLQFPYPFAIMYFMVIMPQQRQRKKVQEMLSAIKAGDRVITSGGIYGTINGLDGDSVILKIATDPQVKIRVARSAIAQVETPEDAK